jgi:hypothetical protein
VKVIFSISLTLAIRNKSFYNNQKKKKEKKGKKKRKTIKYIYVRVTIFQKKVVRKFHCCCIRGGIYNLKKVYSLYTTSTLNSHSLRHR